MGDAKDKTLKREIEELKNKSRIRDSLEAGIGKVEYTSGGVKPESDEEKAARESAEFEEYSRRRYKNLLREVELLENKRELSELQAVKESAGSGAQVLGVKGYEEPTLKEKRENKQLFEWVNCQIQATPVILKQMDEILDTIPPITERVSQMTRRAVNENMGPSVRELLDLDELMIRHWQNLHTLATTILLANKGSGSR